ncbi:MAG: glycosyltransferase family 2 protein [Bacteroidales bacterium]|nr:glycosyltransferase family 2 protein [Bacteroidales bacterium]
MTQFLEWFFWISAFIVFYTYLGYGLLLYVLVRIKRLFVGKKKAPAFDELPEVTLFITAWNEESVIEGKMENCRALNYPKDKLKIFWVTDGTTDSTNEKLKSYSDVTVHFRPERLGKTAAMTRGVTFVNTPLIVFTDANTFLNADSVINIVNRFADQKVGCVAGEKRVMQQEKDKAVSSGEGFYWKYESKLKTWDDELCSVVGAAGELFAIRTHLFEEMPKDTLLDDFILSLRIVMRGYKTAYTPDAYAEETSSAEMVEEEKRKVRIAAGGLQSVWRLRALLNVFKYGTVSFQYISHRVLRWTLTPLLLFLLLPLNVFLIALEPSNLLYIIIFILQILFYVAGHAGKLLEQRKIRFKLLFIPYYFIFMNICVYKGVAYLRKKRTNGAWERAKRA